MAPFDGARVAPKVKSYNMRRRELKVISEADTLLILELARAGLLAYQIAVKFDITASRVKSICDAAAVDVMSRDSQKNKRAKQILAMLLNGSTTEQILNQVDCDRGLVAQVRCRNGFSAPPSKTQARASSSAAQARALVRDGMTIREACKAVKISTATYNKYKSVGN